MASFDLIPALEHKLATAEQIREQIIQMDARGILLTIIKDTLMPQIRKDILTLYAMSYPSDIKSFFDKHRNIVRFLSKKSHPGGIEFKMAHIRWYESLYERQLLEDRLVSDEDKLMHQKQRDVNEEKRRDITLLRRNIVSMSTDETYKFVEADEGHFKLESMCTYGKDPELFKIPNNYKTLMDSLMQGKEWFNIKLTDAEPLLYFVQIKEKHLNDIIKSSPTRISSHESDLSKVKNHLQILGGPLSRDEGEKLDLFFRGSVSTNYNPAIYLSCFDRWQRREFIRQIRRY